MSRLLSVQPTPKRRVVVHGSRLQRGEVDHITLCRKDTGLLMTTR